MISKGKFFTLSFLTILGLSFQVNESHAQAQCRFMAESRPSPSQSRDGAWAVDVENGACQATFNTSGTGRTNWKTTSVTTTKRPSNGTAPASTGGFVYTAKSGFKGKDQFILKICAESGPDKGCANVTYNVTVR